MNGMKFFIDLLNNREKALIIWVLIFLVWALFQKNIRNSIFCLLKALFQKKILIVLLTMFLYAASEVFLLYKMQLWDVFLIKDTVFWVLGIAFVHLLSVNKASQNENYFKKILLDNLKLIFVLEFIVNRYTFSLWVEIIIMPLLFVIVAMSVYTEMKKEYTSVKKVVDSILVIFGVFLIISVLFNIFRDYQGFVNSDILRTFLLPPLLTLAYMPFLYFVALYMAYESFFVRLDIFFKKDKEMAKFVKRRVLALCLVNLGKLNRFAKECTRKLMKLSSRDDMLNMIENFKKNLGIGC
jgi:hypothetical protein